MSTQRCCPRIISFVTWHCVNVRAVSPISKHHGAFIHKIRAVQCTVSLDEWFPIFQRITVPSSTKLEQSNALCHWMNGFPHFKGSRCLHSQHSNSRTRTAKLAPLGPQKHTTQPIPHPSNWLATLSHLQFKCYLFTYLFPYLPRTGCSSYSAWLLKTETLQSFKSLGTTQPTQCHISKTWIVN
jgi:hypothetical protein